MIVRACWFLIWYALHFHGRLCGGRMLDWMYDLRALACCRWVGTDLGSKWVERLLGMAVNGHRYEERLLVTARRNT